MTTWISAPRHSAPASDAAKNPTGSATLTKAPG
ncbi:Uncharacterised protein [Mycobacterium tuberculosis]|nr:Uncharacterised protein [Mycobacterium tuberculosis]